MYRDLLKSLTLTFNVQRPVEQSNLNLVITVDCYSNHDMYMWSGVGLRNDQMIFDQAQSLIGLFPSSNSSFCRVPGPIGICFTNMVISEVN